MLAPLEALIVSAGSGEQALRAASKQTFAAILLDAEMPGLDGFETARLIRGRERSAHTPIIFVTARADDLDRVARAYEVGAVDYVLKPFDPLVMRAKVAVFCDLARQRTARERADELLRAAWESAPNGIALVDADGRLLEANPALRRLTGRETSFLRGSLEEIVCDADRPAVALLRRKLGRGGADSAAVELRVSHPELGEIPVAVLASAVSGPEARTFLLQVTDLRERLRAREARARLLTEQAARAEAEGLAGRLAAAAAITEGLERYTTAELAAELCERLVRVLHLDGAAISVLGEQQHVVAGAAFGAPVDSDRLVAALAAGPPGPVAVADDGTTVLPMRVDGRLLGAIAIVGLAPEAPGHARTFALLHSAVARAALILERARLFERERMIAATLQRDLLPETLPTVPGVSVSAWFTAGGDGMQVGGDWYDAIALPGGRLGVVVGDVAGRGVAAAARMAELRAVARAYALEGHGPAEVLGRVNAYHLGTGPDAMTTLVYAVVEPDRGRVRYASAGHLPPLLVGGPQDAGEPRYLAASGPPLGAVELGRYEERTVPLPPGAMLALYTDGLVERRGEVLDAGLERLRSALTGDTPGDAETARARALERCGATAGDDDVTLVVIRAQERLGTPAEFTLTPDPETLGALRRQLRRWLAEAGADSTETTEVVVAVNEAMQNAIEHGNVLGAAPIEICLDLQDGDVVVVVRDLGHEARHPSDPDRGRGIQLMTGLMDEAHIELGSDMGGAVTLRRRLVSAAR